MLEPHALVMCCIGPTISHKSQSAVYLSAATKIRPRLEAGVSAGWSPKETTSRVQEQEGFSQNEKNNQKNGLYLFEDFFF